jgi:hypothetical protein
MPKLNPNIDYQDFFCPNVKIANASALARFYKLLFYKSVPSFSLFVDFSNKESRILLTVFWARSMVNLSGRLSSITQKALPK